jgi:hypothetical protein
VTDRRVADAARRYVDALRDVDGTGGGSFLTAIFARDWALHDLVIAVGDCFICDEGTCPGERGDWSSLHGRRVRDTPPL